MLDHLRFTTKVDRDMNLLTLPLATALSLAPVKDTEGYVLPYTGIHFSICQQITKHLHRYYT